jgi:integrase
MVGKTELRYSLRTGYLSSAKMKARLLAGRVQQLFQELRRDQGRFMELNDQQIQDIVAKYLERIKADYDEPFGPDDVDRPFDDEASLNNYVRGLDGDKSDLRVEMTTGNYWRVKDDATALLNEFGVSVDDIDEDCTAFSKLCEGLLIAQLKGIDHHKKRLTGFASADLERALDSVLGKGTSVALVPPEPDDEPSILLSELWDHFKAEKVRRKEWRGSTIRNHEPKYNALSQFLGDLPVNQITKSMIRDFRTLLDRLPPHFVRRGYPTLAGVKPDALVGEHDKTMDVTTVGTYMILISSMFAYAVEYDYIKVNPVTSGMIPKKKRNAQGQRLPFSDPDDLARIFDGNLFLKWSKGKPERFWVPLIGLFTGCRLEEAAQLYAEDIKEVDGYWSFNFKGGYVADDEAEEEGQMVKNESAPRVIPMHSLLVDYLKLPEYAKSVSKKCGQLLFPHLTKGPETNFKYSHALSKHFGSYLRNKVGIKNPKKTFHSFRHTLADHLKNEIGDEWIIEELEGRAGKTETSRRYSGQFRAPKLWEEAVSKIKFEVDLSHLSASKWVPKDTDVLE